jgi:intein/homing endonuclease
MRQWQAAIEELPQWAIFPYLAGRFDGDGSVASDGRQDVRIAYGSLPEALNDQQLLQQVRAYRTRVYRYAKARTWVLYVSRFDARDFLNDLRPFSSKLLQQA